MTDPLKSEIEMEIQLVKCRCLCVRFRSQEVQTETAEEEKETETGAEVALSDPQASSRRERERGNAAPLPSDRFYGQRKTTVSVAAMPALRRPFNLLQPALFLQNHLNDFLMAEYTNKLSEKVSESVYGCVFRNFASFCAGNL